MEEAMLSSKLDAVAMEYNQLLTSQLESQRQYFEGLIAAARLDADKARVDMERCGVTATAGFVSTLDCFSLTLKPTILALAQHVRPQRHALQAPSKARLR
jgi:BRCA1-associated protein